MRNIINNARIAYGKTSGLSGTSTVTSLNSLNLESSSTSPVLNRPSVLGSTRMTCPKESPGGNTPPKPEVTRRLGVLGSAMI